MSKCCFEPKLIKCGSVFPVELGGGGGGRYLCVPNGMNGSWQLGGGTGVTEALFRMASVPDTTTPAKALGRTVLIG